MRLRNVASAQRAALKLDILLDHYMDPGRSYWALMDTEETLNRVLNLLTESIRSLAEPPLLQAQLALRTLLRSLRVLRARIFLARGQFRSLQQAGDLLTDDEIQRRTLEAHDLLEPHLARLSHIIEEFGHQYALEQL